MRRLLIGCFGIFAFSVLAVIGGCMWYFRDANARAQRACGEQSPAPTEAARQDDEREARELQRRLDQGPNPLRMRVDLVVGHRAYLIALAGASASSPSYQVMEDEARYLGAWVTIFRVHHPHEDPRGSVVLRKADGSPYLGGYPNGIVVECEPPITI